MTDERWYLDTFMKCFRYEPDTGKFFWIVRRGHADAGQEAGTTGQRGVRIIRTAGKQVLAHRLAWLFVHKRWPLDDIDHINGDPSDNRIDNLREADQTLNNANSKLRSNNTSGYKGVHFSKHARKWRASIRFRGKMKNLGYFDTPELAHEKYMSAAREKFGEFARAG